ncbi:MAG: BACON domain-containing protein [Candidatus Cryptobacteroides sp.]
MKLKYLLSALIASAFVFAGCEDESKVNDGFDNVKVSDSYLTIPEAGGSATITVNADEDWYLVQNENWPEKVTFNKDANGKTIKAKHDVFGNLINEAADIKEKTATWLAADKLQGGAGESTITFSAEATSGGREFELTLVCGNNRQFIRVRQGSLEAVSATCKDVIDGPDGKTYKVKGVCTAIANTTYGNWYLNDGTGEVYIYGTLDANGAEKNFTSLGLEIGDEVEVSGPKTTYGTTIELVNVTVLSIKKSLAKVLTESATYPKENNEFELRVAYKGGNFDSEIPDEYKSWISILGIKSVAGVPSKIEPSPADTAVVTVGLAANAGGDRTGRINFSSGSSEVYYEFTQEGAILDASIAEFLAAEEGQTQYRVKGVIKSISTNSQYHNANITVISTTGEELYLYRVVTSEGNIEDLGLAVRDIVTVVGKRSSYNGVPQMAQGGVLESYEHYEGKTIPEFLALTTSDTNIYSVYGQITAVTDLSESYNNVCLTIKDEDGNELYIYRCKAYDGINVATVNPEVGGYVVVCGKYGEYKGAKQMASGGLILRYTKPEPSTEPEPKPEGGKYVKVTSTPSDWTGKYLIVFGTNAHASLASGSKDLNSTVALTIADDAVVATSEVNAAAVTVAKNGEKYTMTLPDGKYFGMQHNGCLLCDSPFDIDFEYTAEGVKISGYVEAKSNTYYLYSNTNGGSYYRCYVDKTGSAGYTLPTLYKLVAE